MGWTPGGHSPQHPQPEAGSNTVTGTSDDIIELTPPIVGPFVVEAIFNGNEEFCVEGLSANGETVAWLIDREGPYAGRVLCFEEEAVAMLKVEGRGPWQLSLLEINATHNWDGRSPIAGQSDEVLFIPGMLSAFTPTVFAHSGDCNVELNAYALGDVDYVVDVDGDYQGTIGLKPTVQLIQITTEGQWSLQAR